MFRVEGLEFRSVTRAAGSHNRRELSGLDFAADLSQHLGEISMHLGMVCVRYDMHWGTWVGG